MYYLVNIHVLKTLYSGKNKTLGKFTCKYNKSLITNEIMAIIARQ